MAGRKDYREVLAQELDAAHRQCILAADWRAVAVSDNFLKEVIDCLNWFIHGATPA
jgi:hypothetical protein